MSLLWVSEIGPRNILSFYEHNRIDRHTNQFHIKTQFGGLLTREEWTINIVIQPHEISVYMDAYKRWTSEPDPAFILNYYTLIENSYKAFKYLHSFSSRNAIAIYRKLPKNYYLIAIVATNSFLYM